MTTEKKRIQILRGTTQEWTAFSGTLNNGEFGLDTTTRDLKLGDGVNSWANLNKIPKSSDIPTKTSDLTNDSGLITANNIVAGTNIVKTVSNDNVTLSVASTANLPRFSIVTTDNELSSATLTEYGFAEFGTYVTDSDFYSACLSEYNNGTAWNWTAPYWVQPTMTANTTTTADGDYKISGHYTTTAPYYYCMDNSTNTHWSPNNNYQNAYITYTLPINICMDKIQFIYNGNNTPYQYCYGTHSISVSPLGKNFIGQQQVYTAGTPTITIDKVALVKQFRFHLGNINYSYTPRLTQINITPYVNKITGKEGATGRIFYDVSENVTFNDITNTSVTQTNLASVQDFEERWGESNFYGIDTTNQKILLPNKKQETGKYQYLKIK